MYIIVQNNKTMNKIEVLLKQNKKTFHTADLALLWTIGNNNTLLTTIKRYVKKGVLVSVCKGFYATRPIDELDKLELGLSFIHKYGYVSTESVLVESGVINQSIEKITFVSSVSRKFKLAGREYVVRKMKDKFLYNDLGIEKRGMVNKASVERAVVDLLYFNSKAFIDNKSLVDWDKVNTIQKEMEI